VCQNNADEEVIRSRIIEIELENPADTKLVKEILSDLSGDGTWATIDYKDVSRTGFRHGEHLRNMVEMALAYKQPESDLYGDTALKSGFDKALSYWLENDFISDNWWWNQIGTTKALTSILLIMDDDLTESQVAEISKITSRANLNASGARPSGDRIKIAGILAKNLLFKRDSAEFAKNIDVIEKEIKFTTGSRGMQHDYSFHHREDRVNNTTSYGKGYADAFAEWAVYVSETKYAFSAEPMQQLTDYYLDGICKQIAFGKFADYGVMNRGISRAGGYGNYTNTKTLENLLKASNYRKSDLLEMIKLRKGEAAAPKSYAKFFWQTEHFTLQRPDFFTSVRMHSVRNQNMEVPYNGEGLTNHHRGDGTNYLTTSGTEYVGTPPIYDWQKIPGATILQKAVLPSDKEIQKRGLTEFVGATTDGYYGTVGYDFKSPHDPLAAHKAWFFFDDKYVCLGTNINSKANLEAVTTINQTNLNGNIIIKSSNGEQMLTEGQRELTDTQWILHDGVGYVFPPNQKVYISNKPERGSWFSINRQTDSPKETVTSPMFKLWVSHGNKPTDATYQYVVIPTADADLLNGNSIDDLRILSNTKNIQAVMHEDLQICQAVFYQNGSLKISNSVTFTTETSGIVIVKLADGNIKEVTVSDPTRKLSEFTFSVNKKLGKPQSDNADVVNTSSNETQVSVKLPQTVYVGKSVTVTF
ncbi:MAG: chondroitin AC lyase, partial [Spirosomataceae bacterium]